MSRRSRRHEAKRRSSRVIYRGRDRSRVPHARPGIRLSERRRAESNLSNGVVWTDSGVAPRSPRAAGHTGTLAIGAGEVGIRSSGRHVLRSDCQQISAHSSERNAAWMSACFHTVWTAVGSADGTTVRPPATNQFGNRERANPSSSTTPVSPGVHAPRTCRSTDGRTSSMSTSPAHSCFRRRQAAKC